MDINYNIFNLLKHLHLHSSEDCTHHLRTQRFKLAHVEPEVRKQAKDAILDFIRFLKITMTMLMLSRLSKALHNGDQLIFYIVQTFDNFPEEYIS